MTTTTEYALFSRTLADGTTVSFAHGYCGPEAIARAVEDARETPGRIVELTAAEHPMEGGRTFTRIRFFVATDAADNLAGHVRAASDSWPDVGSETYAYPSDSDALIAVKIAVRLLKMSGRVDAWIFRTSTAPCRGRL